MSLNPPEFDTLAEMREMLAAYNFSDEELSELVDPQLGVITGFSELLEQLELLRKLDLGATPPALGIKSVKDA